MPAVEASLRVAYFAKLPPCLVAIEACASSHQWSRQLRALGHTVRLMPPAFVGEDVLAVDLDQGKVGFRIGADDLGGIDGGRHQWLLGPTSRRRPHGCWWPRSHPARAAINLASRLLPRWHSISSAICPGMAAQWLAANLTNAPSQRSAAGPIQFISSSASRRRTHFDRHSCESARRTCCPAEAIRPCDTDRPIHRSASAGCSVGNRP
jgi:hypothetical protein